MSLTSKMTCKKKLYKSFFPPHPSLLLLPTFCPSFRFQHRLSFLKACPWHSRSERNFLFPLLGFAVPVSWTSMMPLHPAGPLVPHRPTEHPSTFVQSHSLWWAKDNTSHRHSRICTCHCLNTMTQGQLCYVIATVQTAVDEDVIFGVPKCECLFFNHIFLYRISTNHAYNANQHGHTSEILWVQFQSTGIKWILQ